MAVGAGKLDRRITIERAGITTNDLNEEVEAWPPDGGTTIGTFWAMRDDESNRIVLEGISAGVLSSFQMSRFVVRSDSETRTITPKDRISYDGDKWNIKGIKETRHGRRRFLELTAVRDLD